MTKKILLTASAFAALAFAGAANAGELTAVINGINVTEAAPYRIASERNNAADATGANTVLVLELGTPVAFNAAQARSYEATVNVSGGGTFAANPTIDVSTSAGAATVSALTTVASTATSRTYRFTVTKDAAAGNLEEISFIWGAAGGIASSANEVDIAFSTAVNDVTGDVLVGTVDTASSTTLVTYRPAVVEFSTTPRSVLAALPDFRLFTTAVTGTPAVVSADGLTVGSAALAGLGDASVATPAGGVFYTGLNSAIEVTRDGIIQGATVVISGAALADEEITPTLLVGAGLGTAVTGTRSGSTVTYTLNNANADLFSAAARLVLDQTATEDDQSPIAAGAFTISWKPTYASGYTAPANAVVKSFGSIELEGTNYIAPWFSGSQAQSQSQLRLSNKGANPANVHVRISSLRFGAGATNFFPGTHTCATGPFVIPAGDELVIGTDKITACFGAFVRGDLHVTVEAEEVDITAKVRNSNAQGNFETSLGRQ